MTGVPRAAAAGLTWALAALTGGADLGAQTLGDGYVAAAASPHAHATAVAAAIRIPSGTAHDPPDGEGTALLLGRIRAEQAVRRLDPSRAVVSVRVTRDATVYTLVCVPEAWRESLETLDAVVFDAPVPQDLLFSTRAELQERLRFESGSPVLDFRREALAMLAAPDPAWARPPRGTAASVENLDLATLTAHRDARYRRGAAALAVVGALPPDVDVSVPAAPPPPPAGVAWLLGDRTVLVQEVTSAWLAVAYPISADLPRTSLELLAHMLREELDPVPPDADRYSVDVRLDVAPAGPVLVVEASVLPESAARWEAKVLTAVRRLAERSFDEDFFRWRRRRFRTSRLLEEARPEAEASRHTEDLLRSGRVRDLDLEIWGLDAGALQAAARALGEPRILVFGPDLRDGQGAGR